MTTPINLGLKSASGIPGAGKQSGGAAAGDAFAALLGAAGTGGGGQSGTAVAVARDGYTEIRSRSSTEGALADSLGALVGALLELDEAEKNGFPLDTDTPSTLSALVEKLQTLLGDESSFERNAASLDDFAALATELGLDVGVLKSGAEPLDALAALAGKIAGQIREEAPDLATRLTDLVKTLDAHSARIEALANSAPPDADMRKRLAQSENKLDPNAAISGDVEGDEARTVPAGESTQQRKPARPLPEFQPPEPRPEAARQNNAHRPESVTGTPGSAPSAPQAMGGEAAKSGELPDGLSFSANQNAPANHALAAARPVANAAYVRPEPQINLPHVAVEIARQLQNGVNRFEIRLNPPELGRIDVRLEMDQSGNVTARLAVERSETLDLLQRDQRTLEKALAEAGLDGDKTDLEFSLGENGTADAEQEPWSGTAGGHAPEPDTETEHGPLYRGYARLDAVNLWV